MTADDVHLDLRRIPPFSAVPWGTFIQNPRIMYNLFEPQVCPQGGGKPYHSDKAFDMTSGRQLGKQNEMKVDSVDELHRLTKDLLKMPILFHVKVEHTRTDNYVVVKVRKKWRNEFAVLVNPQHLGIREVLSRRLSEAMQYMTEGKNFCLKISFGDSVKQWYSGMVDGTVGFCDGRNNSDNNHMTLYIHNYTTPYRCCVSPLMIICCCPFWMLFGGPCYLTHRKIKCIDMEEYIRELPVTLLQAQQTIIVQHHVGPGYGQPPPGPGSGQPPPGSGYGQPHPGPGYGQPLPPHAQYPGAQYSPQQFGHPQMPQQNGGQYMAQPMQGQNVGQQMATPPQQSQYEGQVVRNPPPYSI